MSSITLSLALRGRLLSGTQTTFQGALFGNSEPGFTFEPWDITTLYQDRAGTTPVTAAGQSVGLRLDKSKGLALGAERGAALTLPGWTVTSGVTVSGGVAAFSSAAQNSNAYNVVGTVEVGKTYRVSLTVSSYVSGTAALLLPGGSGRGAITSNGTFTGIYTASSTGVIYLWAQGASNNTFVISDYSVRELAGNHEVAINDAARGIYGWMPKTGRRNQLTYSEQFDNAAWTKPFAGTGVVAIVTQNYGMAPDGTATACRLQLNKGAGATAGDYSGFQQTYSIASQSTGSIYIKTANGTTKSVTLRTNTTTTSVSVTAEWQRVSVTEVSSSFLQIILRGTYGTSDSADLLIWHPQLETGSTATAYQRVVSNYDITEAGVPSCYYVLANGVNTAYSTPTITPNTDKVQVFAGVRKNSDLGSSAVTIIESSVRSDTTDGSFMLFARDTFTPAMYEFGSRGTIFRLAGSNNASFAAPITNVLTGIGDISGDTATLRVNGTQVAQATTDQGTGNYLAYPAYIYARGGTSMPFNGLDFGHVVRFGPNLDAATIARVESLLARNTPEVTL